MQMAPNKTLSHYRLIEKIGQGGMGEVWKARDEKLNRRVAIKILSTSLTADEERRLRFRREALAAAALSHPNIAVIHEIGERDGVSFIVMEHITGQSLRERMGQRALGLKEWLSLMLPVAEALAHAHRHGIVHRDLKPDNVMITDDGHVKLLDFGLAKLVQSEIEPVATVSDFETRLKTISHELTRAGKVVGTVAYMSPEQARGVTVDHRTDLWSLGVMVYELATARLPFKAGSAVETLSAVINAEPPPPSEIAEVPAEADRIVRKALQKAPADRYQHADEMATDLRNLHRDLDSGRVSIPTSGAARARGRNPVRAWFPVVVALALLVAAALYMWKQTAEAPGQVGSHVIDSVAVLPFTSSGGDDDTKYLGDGITESVINSLSKISSLRVVPRSVVFALKDEDRTPQALGEELGVGAVVTGRVAQRGDALIVSAELMDVASVSQLWGDQYNRKKTDIFAVQEEITREIARNLRLRLSLEERQEIGRHPTENPEAYKAYLRGQALAVFYSKDELEAARRHFERALSIDPNYALALAGLATVESMYYRNVEARPELLDRAEGYAKQALAIDPDLGRAHASLAEVHAVRYEYAAAVNGFREAIRLDPEEPSYHDNLSWSLAYMTPPRGVEAEAAAREAIRLSPRFAAAYYHLGRALIAQGRFGEAIEAFEYCKEIDRTANFAALGMGQAYLAMGEYEKAIEYLSDDNTPLELVYRGAAQAGLGRADEALALLEEAVEAGYGDHLFLEASRYFDTLRSETRFQTLLKKARPSR